MYTFFFILFYFEINLSLYLVWKIVIFEILFKGHFTALKADPFYSQWWTLSSIGEWGGGRRRVLSAVERTSLYLKKCKRLDWERADSLSFFFCELNLRGESWDIDWPRFLKCVCFVVSIADQWHEQLRCGRSQPLLSKVPGCFESSQL